jgi:hypothetical protein
MSASRANSSTLRVSPRRWPSMPAPGERRVQLRGVWEEPAQRVAQRLAALVEGGAHHRLQLRGLFGAWHVERRQPDHRALHLGSGVERAARHVQHVIDVVDRGQEHGRRSVRALPRRRQPALGHLALHHDHHARDAAVLLHQVARDHPGDGVGQVAHHDHALVTARVHEASEVHAPGVPVHHPEVGRLAVLLPQDRDHVGITLEADDLGARVDQRPRERAEPGAQLYTALTGRELRGLGDAAHRDLGDQEILRVMALGAQAMARQDGPRILELPAVHEASLPEGEAYASADAASAPSDTRSGTPRRPKKARASRS